MSQVTMASVKLGGVAAAAILLFFAFAGGPAKADPCAIACRSQHNACRMAAKLLFSPRCDSQLQACISGCFAAGRFNRGVVREGPPRDFGAREHGGPPPDMRGLPERGPPRGFRDFRDQRDPRWLGSPRWNGYR